jgi:hypothetical protein
MLGEVEDLGPGQLRGDEDADRHADDAPEHGGDHGPARITPSRIVGRRGGEGEQQSAQNDAGEQNGTAQRPRIIAPGNPIHLGAPSDFQRRT